MTDYDYFQFGGVQYPLTASTTNSLVRDADPALYWSLLYWTSVLTTHLQDRLLAEVTGGLAPITAAVKTAIHYDPGPYLLDHPENLFPLLAAYRKTARFADRTVTWEHEVAEWEVAYVFPCLNWQAAKKLTPFLHAVGQVLVNRTSQGFDPGYSSGTQVFGYLKAYVEEIGFTGSRYGTFQDGNGLVYPAWFGTCQVKERVVPRAGDLEAFEGVDAHIDVRDASTLTTVDDVASVSYEALFPSTLSNLKLWLRSDLGVTEGSTFTWADQSGLGDSNRNAVQATAANQPTVDPTDPHFNGKPAIVFTGAQVLNTGTWSAALSQACTWYAVFRPGDNSAQRTVTDGIGGSNRQRISTTITTGVVNMYAGGTARDGTATIANSTVVMCVVFNGASSSVYVNNITTADVTANPGTNSLTGLKIGQDQGGSGSALEGRIAELAAFSGAHSEATRRKMMNYLGARYGIAITDNPT